MNTKLIRFRSGEDVLCDLVNETDTEISIDNALVAVPQGQGQLGFAPWSPIISKEEKDIPVSKNFIVYIANVDQDVLTQYNNMFGNIVTPPEKQIII